MCIGCQRVQKILAQDDMVVESDPVKVIWIIEQSKDIKDDLSSLYIDPVLKSPQELVRVRYYTNVDSAMSPTTLIQFEFDSFSDASKYMNRPEIAEIMDFSDALNSAVFTFIERSAHLSGVEDVYPVMGVLFLDYLPGDRQSYIDWVNSMRPDVIDRPYLKLINTYENYYNVSPNRFVELGFSNIDDVDTYLKDSESFFKDLNVRTSSWEFYVFKLVYTLQIN